jgi:hypothetical protein
MEHHKVWNAGFFNMSQRLDSIVSSQSILIVGTFLFINGLSDIIVNVVILFQRNRFDQDISVIMLRSR